MCSDIQYVARAAFLCSLWLAVHVDITLKFCVRYGALGPTLHRERQRYRCIAPLVPRNGRRTIAFFVDDVDDC